MIALLIFLLLGLTNKTNAPSTNQQNIITGLDAPHASRSEQRQNIYQEGLRPPVLPTLKYKNQGSKSKPSAPDDLDKKLDRMSNCESGYDKAEPWHGVASTNTGNGFYGAFQFAPSTWHSIILDGRYLTGNPINYNYAFQHKAAKWLWLHSDPSHQWPNCYMR